MPRKGPSEVCPCEKSVCRLHPPVVTGDEVPDDDEKHQLHLFGGGLTGIQQDHVYEQQQNGAMAYHVR